MPLYRTGDSALALAEHFIETGHPIDRKGVKFLDNHLSSQHCCVLEGWHILHSLNRELHVFASVLSLFALRIFGTCVYYVFVFFYCLLLLYIFNVLKIFTC